MSQKDGFGSGFLLGALFGGVVGGVVGAIAASRSQRSAEQSLWPEADGGENTMEAARQGLEDKISELNLAIDDVRQQIGTGAEGEED